MRFLQINRNIKIALAIVVIASGAFLIGNIELAEDSEKSAPVIPAPSISASATPTPPQKSTATPSVKPSTSKAATTKTEAQGGFKSKDINSLNTAVDDINSYTDALEAGNNALASQLCTALQTNYNEALKNLVTTSDIAKIETLLINSQDAIYAAVSDCTAGFAKNNQALINQSLTEFQSASKLLTALLKLTS